jgi:hypothetical protein
VATWAPRRNDACRPDGSVQVRQTSSPAQSCDMNERTAKEVVEEMYRRQHSGDPTVLDDLVAELSGESCSGTSRTVSAGAAADAVRACGAHRLVLVHPPWFDEEIDRMGVGYFRDQGFDVTLLKATGLSRDPSRVHTEGITDWVSRHLGDGDEALFMAGNGFRAARAVSELEQRTGRLVLQANQVLLWSIIAATHAPLTIKGWGSSSRHFRRQPLDPPSRRRSADRKATRLRASHGTLDICRRLGHCVRMNELPVGYARVSTDQQALTSQRNGPACPGCR